MKKLICFTTGLLLISFLTCSFALGETEVKVGKGDLKIGGIIQAGYSHFMEDRTGNDSFSLRRVRFLFWGTIIPEKVKYSVQLEHAGTIDELGFKAQFFYIKNTEIAVGRFLPTFTLYMPYSIARLEMINFPFTTTYYGVWKQCGLQSTTQTEYVDFNIGIFNGGDIPNNWADNNDAKDILLRADLKPSGDELKLRFGGYAWLGFAAPPIEWSDREQTFTANRFGGFVTADYTKDEITYHFRGELLAARDEKIISWGERITDMINSRAILAHFGVQPIKQVEFLLRYDSYDPNTKITDNKISAITGGVNYYLDDINVMFYLNFIHNMEQGEDKDNDQILAQMQIVF
jgi:hypothetical protein